MSEVMPRDILLRVGYGAMKRAGVWALPGAGRGRVEELKETFTRASTKVYRDRDGVGRKAAANVIAPEYPPGLVDAEGLPLFGLSLHGARTQLVTDPENFGTWAVNGTVGRTGGQADPFGGTAAYLLDSNTPGASDNINQAVTFTGDGTKARLLFVRAGTSTQSQFSIRDNTAGVHRHLVAINWSGGVPTLQTLSGTGVLFAVDPWGGGWYVISASGDGVVAANSNTYNIYPDITGAGGTVFAFGANAWNAPFPAPYQGPGGGASPSAADSFTVPSNFGPGNTTILYRFARPVWADAAGVDLGFFPTPFLLSSATPRIETYFGRTSRDFHARFGDAGSDAGRNIPAGNPLVFISQHKDATTAPAVAVDVGDGVGLTAFDTGATPFASYLTQSLVLNVTAAPLAGVLVDLVVLRGLFTRAEAMAVLD